MASLYSKWEARITIPTGGWVASMTDAGGTDASAISLSAGATYYWSSAGSGAEDLPKTIEDQINASGTLSGGYTVVVADGVPGAGGTGQLSIAGPGTFSITWTSTDLRDCLGFTGNVSGADVYTSPNHVEGLWLPACPVDTPFGLSSSGLVVSAVAETLSEDGTFYSSHGSKHTRNEYTYRAVTIARTVAASESVTNESYESFWLDAIRGEEPWATAGRQLRYYKDCTDDATYKTYNVINATSPDISRHTEDYDGFWTVGLQVVENS